MVGESGGTAECPSTARILRLRSAQVPQCSEAIKRERKGRRAECPSTARIPQCSEAIKRERKGGRAEWQNGRTAEWRKGGREKAGYRLRESGVGFTIQNIIVKVPPLGDVLSEVEVGQRGMNDGIAFCRQNENLDLNSSSSCSNDLEGISI